MFRFKLAVSCALVGLLSLVAVGGAHAETAKAAKSKGTLYIYHYGTDGKGTQEPAAGKYGTDAAIKAVNKANSAGGYQLKVIYCGAPAGTATVDPSIPAKCATDGVANSGVVAFVAGSLNEGGGMKILNAAQMPCVSCNLYGSDDFSSDYSFATQIGSLSQGGSAAIAADVLKSTKIGLAWLDVPTGAVLEPLINATVLAQRNLKIAKAIPIAITATDVSSQVAALQSAGIDSLIPALTLDVSTRLIKSAQQLGLNVPIIVPSGVFSEAAVNANLGKTVKNIYAGYVFDPASKGYAEYEADMKAIGQQGTTQDTTQAAQSWLGVKMVADAVSQLVKQGKQPTRQNIAAFFRSQSAYNTNGMTPPLNYTQRTNLLGGIGKNFYNSTVVSMVFKNGKYVKVGKQGPGGFVDVFGTPGSTSTTTTTVAK